MVYLSQTSRTKRLGSQGQSVQNQDPQHKQRVDRHLKETSYYLDADKRERQIEYYQQMNKLHDTNPQSAYHLEDRFTLDSDPNMQSLTHELDRSQEGDPDQLTPEEIVQQRLYEDEQLEKASEAYKQAYAQQFIENARRGGWEVQLGPNFEVLSVKKIKEKRTPSLFNEGLGGASR